jgi:hypothetical protein
MEWMDDDDDDHKRSSPQAKQPTSEAALKRSSPQAKQPKKGSIFFIKFDNVLYSTTKGRYKQFLFISHLYIQS